MLVHAQARYTPSALAPELVELLGAVIRRARTDAQQGNLAAQAWIAQVTGEPLPPPAPAPQRFPPAHVAPGAPAKLKTKPRASLPAPPAWQALADDLGCAPGAHPLTYAPGDAVYVLNRPDALSHLVVAELAEVVSLAGDDDRVNVLTVDGQRRRPRELQLVHAALCFDCADVRRLPAQLVGGQLVCPLCRQSVDAPPPVELLALPSEPSARFFCLALRRAWTAGESYRAGLAWARKVSPPPPPQLEVSAPAPARRAA